MPNNFQVGQLAPEAEAPWHGKAKHNLLTEQVKLANLPYKAYKEGAAKDRVSDITKELTQLAKQHKGALEPSSNAAANARGDYLRTVGTAQRKAQLKQEARDFANELFSRNRHSFARPGMRTHTAEGQMSNKQLAKFQKDYEDRLARMEEERHEKAYDYGLKNAEQDRNNAVVTTGIRNEDDKRKRFALDRKQLEEQKVLDHHYNEWLQQQNYPQAQLERIRQMLTGLPASSFSQVYNQAPVHVPTSNASNIGNVAAQVGYHYAGRPRGFEKEGGRVTHAEGDTVSPAPAMFLDAPYLEELRTSFSGGGSILEASTKNAELNNLTPLQSLRNINKNEVRQGHKKGDAIEAGVTSAERYKDSKELREQIKNLTKAIETRRTPVQGLAEAIAIGLENSSQYGTVAKGILKHKAMNDTAYDSDTAKQLALIKANSELINQEIKNKEDARGHDIAEKHYGDTHNYQMDHLAVEKAYKDALVNNASTKLTAEKPLTPTTLKILMEAQKSQQLAESLNYKKQRFVELSKKFENHPLLASAIRAGREHAGNIGAAIPEYLLSMVSPGTRAEINEFNTLGSELVAEAHQNMKNIPRSEQFVTLIKQTKPQLGEENKEAIHHIDQLEKVAREDAALKESLVNMMPNAVEIAPNPMDALQRQQDLEELTMLREKKAGAR